MGLVTVSILTCDRCGASTTGHPPAGSCKIELAYLDGHATMTGYYCPSCTEAIVAVATTPPR